MFLISAKSSRSRLLCFRGAVRNCWPFSWACFLMRQILFLSMSRAAAIVRTDFPAISILRASESSTDTDISHLPGAVVVAGLKIGETTPGAHFLVAHYNLQTVSWRPALRAIELDRQIEVVVAICAAALGARFAGVVNDDDAVALDAQGNEELVHLHPGVCIVGVEAKARRQRIEHNHVRFKSVYPFDKFLLPRRIGQLRKSCCPAFARGTSATAFPKRDQ